MKEIDSLQEFFTKLGLDKKETKVLLSIIRLGTQPSSIIAKHAKLDRTTTYRILTKLCKKQILSQSKTKGTTVFYLDKLSSIQNFINQKKQKLQNLEKDFKKISPQLNALQSSFQTLPKIQIYEGEESLENFYKDIIKKAIEQKLLLIRILGSNTFSQQLERKELGDIIKNFKQELESHKIKSDILIAQGNLTREWLTRFNSFEKMSNLPAAGGATNVILVGESVFLVSFRDFPVGIRIDHPDVAQTMHFLFDVNRKNP